MSVSGDALAREWILADGHGAHYGADFERRVRSLAELIRTQIASAYAAGRRSVIESEEMAVLRRCADVALDEEWNWPKSSTDDAAIRAALEVLKS